MVGHLATLDPNKGIDRPGPRRRAAERRRGPTDDPVHLVLAGAPTRPTSRRSRGAARRSPPAGSTLARPAARATTSPDFFAALDVFAMPSRTDSFGIVFLEAWANGLPVVAAAAGGVAEVVDHGETGLLVPFGDVQALADALGRLLADRDTARRLGEAGRALVAAATPGTTGSGHSTRESGSRSERACDGASRPRPEGVRT